MGSKLTQNSKINPPVFFGSALLLLLLVGYAVIWPEAAQGFFGDLQSLIIDYAGWFYVLAVAIFLIFVAYLGLSRHGEIKLGPDHSEPDYSYTSWFAMLFSAGMGIGLMFFGVAEPVMHFLAPPVGDGGSVDAAREAMKLTFFHWGLHAWAIYAVVALILAYFSYRHKLPLTLRSALYPIIGDRIYGPIGHAVDIFAILGTVLGVATSLGYGVLQVNSGLAHLFGLPENTTVQIMLIIGITGLATISVVSGLDTGIRRLSELNLGLAVLLMLFILILGPTALLLKTFVQNTGAYLSDIVDKTFNLYAYKPNDWIGGWTLFYWGWWIAWSPFVGMFIARISRGRTIRQFVMGVLFVPAGFTMIWMTVFGNSAIDLILNQGLSSLGDTVNQNTALALFAFLEQFPFSGVLSLLATLMVVVFFVTSSDSGSMVVDMLASGGHDDTPIWQRIFWSSSEGIVAIALLLAGGLKALQTATIVSALPFAAILLFACYGLHKALVIDSTKRASFNSANSTPVSPMLASKGPNWRQRIQSMSSFPSKGEVENFLNNEVAPAMNAMAEEYRSQGYEVDVQARKDRVVLEILHGSEIDFLYGVRMRPYTPPSFLMPNTSEKAKEEKRYFRAEVFLSEGGQNYDVYGYSRDHLLADVLDKYEKHMFFLEQVRET
ncbi:BCCT family transporter [Pokkaliibacter sp. CJK22405]|uniref:BCCT family transporter n=1 Tax=Pokkaliibacter sp. CJK22405 TaxID=3384615 RepID=UPI00398516BB